MTTDKNDLEPLDPTTAQELFLDHKAMDCTKATVRNRRYHTNNFLDWCAEAGIDNLNDLSGRDIQRFRLWRNETADLSKVTLRVEMSSLRVFIKWAGSVEAVPEDLYNKVMVPRVPPAERRDDEILDAEDAQEVLRYLSTYQYASIEHTLLAFLWETGMRIGAANSIDLKDVNFDEERIRLVHRPDEGTTLKNGKGGERLVAMTPALTELLKDHVKTKRHEVTDDHDREPLFTTVHGRMHQNTMRRMTNRITAPCYRNEPCPDCEADVNDKCPEAVSPHAVRRGSITHYLSEDVPVEIVSDRMNVSRRVLSEHYDKRSDEVKLEQRRGYLDNI